MKSTILRTILFGLGPVINRVSKRHASFREEARKHDCVLQIKLKNNKLGRYFIFKDGLVTSRAGIHENPDVGLVFKNLNVALKILSPTADIAYKVHAAKNFLMGVEGPDYLSNWILKLMQRVAYEGFSYGTAMKDGSKRYTTITNGGPLHVYVKEGKILRLTPIDFTDEDAGSFKIDARGKTFKPKRQSTIAPHALSNKGAVYSENRVLYPMKRVDFDPDGERNPQNRGISGYERISWDEALDIVAKEINRQKREHGPGSIFLPTPSHHQWGNIGYYLSALMRFGNQIGFTRMAMNPDSWEGWFWGAQHHVGHSMRAGASPGYGTMEDCMKEADQIIFWSADPESTNGIYGGFESTQRRLWAKENGIEFVHIDPHFNPTAQLLGGKWMPIKPATDAALAIAIMYVWLEEGLYDKDYVATRTTGFDEWCEYLLGASDGEPKTPEWQENETGVPARDVRALARSWGKKKTYLGCGVTGTGFGGACRGATGAQWARCMVMMLAMQGWGKPGINMGHLTAGAPLDLEFYFPGYADGGISGDLANNGNMVNNYQRMPHVLSMNPVKQQIPKQKIPEAIIEGKCTGYLWDCASQENQFTPFEYPMKGYSPIRMIYRYGGSLFGTATESGRFAEAFRHKSIEFIVNQSIFMEGDAKFADIILPACTSFERWDIGEACNGGGYGHHSVEMLNHRVIALQQKCIEPLGESKSDYQIFEEILERLGLGTVFTEGCSELDWCKRQFDSSDLPDHISWKQFVKKGYFVVPAEEEELRAPLSMKWFAEGRKKDIPEPQPLPSQFAEEFGYGLQTPSGKFEFVPTILKRNEKDHPDRPAVNRYIPSWEGLRTTELVDKYPIQMIATHSRYSFHTYADNKGFTDQIKDHRRLIHGHYFWVIQINADDAKDRGIKQNDLVKIYNDRGAVVCVAEVTPMVSRRITKGYEASAKYMPLRVGGEMVEIGGCLNNLSPSRSQTQGTHSMGPNSTLVQIEKYQNVNALRQVLMQRAS
ncbi:molybdopterin-dependent oxidoreductase [Maricurvus nonylphenolicus]|uniref:molybdopterin-dependent oxidoreductase n=1 Tax=Maricurvus nonylphenolicus TaxID=1008307 RepID=UPI0036F23480